jgi:hypothetical protein
MQAVTSPEVRCRLAGRTGVSVAVALLLLADLLLPDRPVGFVYVPQPSEKREGERSQTRPVSESVARAVRPAKVAVWLMQSFGLTPTGHEPRPPQRYDHVRP